MSLSVFLAPWFAQGGGSTAYFADHTSLAMRMSKLQRICVRSESGEGGDDCVEACLVLGEVVLRHGTALQETALQQGTVPRACLIGGVDTSVNFSSHILTHTCAFLWCLQSSIIHFTAIGRSLVGLWGDNIL